MGGILCSMVGGSVVTAVAQVIRRKLSMLGAGATISTAQSKFGGASASFSGSNQYINVPHHSQLDLSNYTNWTIEGWFYFTEPTSRTAFNKDGITGSAYPGYTIYTNASKQPVFGVGGSAGNWVTITGSSALSNTTWYHFAAVKNGSTITFYRDGTSIGTTTYVGYADQGRPLYIGWESSGAYMYGYIDEFRISKIARYTSSFTPSASAFTIDNDTVFLSHFNGSNGSTYFEDDNGSARTAKTVTVTGVTCQTAQSKFGGSSAYFDGAGSDRLQTTATSDFQMAASGNAKTFECWVYINNLASMSRNSPNHLPALMGQMDTGGNVNWGFGPNSAGGVTIYWWSGANNWYHSSTTNLTTGTWYHLALVMNGTSLKGYVNGTEYVSATIANTPTTNVTTFTIGAEYTSTINAYVDEFRVSNTVRYSAAFTPPTDYFQNDANTVLLLHMDATANTANIFDDGGATPS